MSVETKSALDAAVQAHIQSESEEATLVTGYVLYASNQNLDQLDNDETAYFAEYGDGQPMHVSLGLAVQHATHLQAKAAI